MKQRFSQEDPIDKVGDWVMELATTRMLGSAEPNVLGIDYFDEDSLFVFRRLLQGDSIEQVKNAIKREYPGSSAESLVGEVEEICDSFQSSILLNSMLSESQSPVYSS